ncbi:hypothetical protein QIS74_12425 [Colletotrichum tabaci]|uniref:Uncharacterized protein n=1 Tax=Colletotrichum tabaci TaxID=1209068 RepID=A0AAV9SWV7_9PEZI
MVVELANGGTDVKGFEGVAEMLVRIPVTAEEIVGSLEIVLLKMDRVDVALERTLELLASGEVVANTVPDGSVEPPVADNVPEEVMFGHWLQVEPMTVGLKNGPPVPDDILVTPVPTSVPVGL